MPEPGRSRRGGSSALQFVLIIGIINLFADLTYEGGRSIVGPFLGSLGASGGIVGFVSGLGELLGYALRSVTGYLADKTRKYWVFTFVGYAVNMLAVPALSLAWSRTSAATLVVLERTGRAIRRPSVETMLSHAAKDAGRGRVFGLNEFLDQVGATIGPLLVALVLWTGAGFRRGFAWLLVPAVLCLAWVLVARFRYPKPQELEPEAERPVAAKGFSRSYWLLFAAGAFIAAGFADFSLIAFHLHRTNRVGVAAIPILYSAAMATAALSALILGRLLDRVGTGTLIAAFLLGAFFAPLVFLGGTPLVVLGMVLWGIGLGAQDSLFKAVLAGVIPASRRATGFGLFDTGFGLAWFIGSAAMGQLYDRSIPVLVVVSVALELAALPVLLKMRGRPS